MSDQDQAKKGKPDKRHSTSDAHPSPSSSTRRQSVRDAWKSIKDGALWKRASLPEFPIKNIFRSPSPSPSPGRSPSRRRDDIEEGAFCDCLIEVMKRSPKYHKYLSESTRAECDEEYHPRRGTV
ncbi:hypothetical protein MMC24_003406 [Lignoscripta atroalba]|nr:hypothetical protein [Lignoscripta atroalba]